MLRDHVTALLAEAVERDEPDRGTLDRLVPVVYDELRRMARAQLGREDGRIQLDTTELVHEAYVRLVDAQRLPVESRGYFFGAAARAMRQVLVDAARRRKRQKRGGGEEPVTLDDALTPSSRGIDLLAEDLLTLDEALTDLASAHPRPARVLECRYFGGLTVEETAAALELGSRTVDRELAFARAWLQRELGGERGSGRPQKP